MGIYEKFYVSKSKYIYFSETNHRGGIAVYGELGVRQYYGYTEKEARRMYEEECEQKIFINKKER